MEEITNVLQNGIVLDGALIGTIGYGIKIAAKLGGDIVRVLTSFELHAKMQLERTDEVCERLERIEKLFAHLTPQHTS